MKRCVLQPRRLIWAALIVLALPAMGQNIFNCTSFATSGTCGVGGGQQITPYAYTISGGVMDFVPAGATHGNSAVWWHAAVNDQAFTTTFTWVPNGYNFAFALNNCQQPGCGSGQGNSYAAGAGCEGGFYQAFDGPPYPNNYYALMFDSYSPLTNGGSFTYSSVQTYQVNVSPCIPNDLGPNYYPVDKISTSPVAMNSSTQGTPTGDTYSATVIYTGTNLVVSIYDVTAGGSCPGLSCFTYSWPVYIPSIVGGTTAYVGFTSGIGTTTTYPLYVDNWSYTVLSAANAPTMSPTGGTYGGTQSVTLSSTSSGAIICYNTTGAPATNGTTGCASGTLYTGAISVSSSETIYAVAGGTGYADSAISNAVYKIGSTAAQPTFYPNTTCCYAGTQYVTLSVPSGQTAYYNTTGSPTCSSTAYSSPITVSSTETLYAIGCGSGLSNSAVGSMAYTIGEYTSSGGTASAANVTYSPVPGSYSGSQTVTLSSSTSSSYICYTLASSPPALTPQPNNDGTCAQGTLYSSPVTVSSSETLYAMASTPYLGPPSSLTAATYTIGAAPASTPTFSPVAGSYVGTQHITLSTTSSGAIICFNTTGAPATNGATSCAAGTLYSGTVTVSSSETLYAVAGGTGYTDSSVGSASYVVSSAAPAVIKGKAVITGKMVVH